MTILRIPAGMMAGEHDALAALGLVRIGICRYDQCLEVQEQKRIRPFLQERRGLLRQLQFPAVKSTGLVREPPLWSVS